MILGPKIRLSLLLPLLAAAFLASPAQSTRRKGVKPQKKLPQTELIAQIVYDTISSPQEIETMVRLSDFKKAIASRVETIMISNASETDTVVAVEVDIDYRTPDGKQLNRRTVTFRSEIPPGETRHASVPSWDRQQLFYHVSTPPVRKTQRTSPFTVTITPLRLLTKSPLSNPQPL